MATTTKKNIGWEMTLDVLLIIAGGFAIALPLIAGIGFELLVGWLFSFGGIAHIVYAFRSRRESGGFAWKILVGLLYLFSGGYLLFFPLSGVAALTLALAVLLLVEGTIETILFFQIRPIPGAGWMLFDGIITLILGFTLWATWPATSLFALGILVGISLVASGVSRLMMTQAPPSMVPQNT